MIISNNEGDQQPESAAAGGAGGETGQSLKKGPWTAAEDAILIEYVKKHGEGNWNAVQKNSGLARCGKSCRLRWANHLRPNLKKGSFTPEEEKIIIELHAKLGNKWARMASQLPGRTDNEIKNYWNTRMKRRQRAGLPLYPQEIQQEAVAYNLHQRHDHPQRDQNKPPLNLTHPNPSSLLFSPYSSSQCRKHNYSPSSSFPFFDQLSFTSSSSSSSNPLQNPPSSNFYANPSHQFGSFTDPNGNGGNSYLPLTHAPQCGSSMTSSVLNKQSFPVHSVPPQTTHGTYNGCEGNLNFASMGIGAPYDQPVFGLVPGMNSGLPSSQTPSGTPASSHASGMVGANSSNNNKNGPKNEDFSQLFPPKSSSQALNSGLLDALLAESQTLSRNSTSKRSQNSSSPREGSINVSQKGKSVAVDESTEDETEDTVPVESAPKISEETTAETQKNLLISSQSSAGKKRKAEDGLEEINSMDDDDLVSLLNNFPSSMPVPEWYRSGERQQQHQQQQQPHNLSCVTSDDVSQSQRHDAAASCTPKNGGEMSWALGSCWNNMPGMHMLN